jgi:hypothetical protein
MIRFAAVFWLGLVLASGCATFIVKYAAQDIDDQLARTHKQIVAEQQEIRVLTAEWTYLNQPERLAALNRRFLQLVPIDARQLQRKIEDIPWRTPVAAPAAVIAAAPAAALSPGKRAATAAVAASRTATLPVQLAKADPAATAAGPLDALFALIAEKKP